MNQIKFVDGLIAKKPHQNAPSFIKCNLSINIEKLINFLHTQSGEWLNVDILEKKDGTGFFAKINDWKPEKTAKKIHPQSMVNNNNEVDIESVPF